MTKAEIELFNSRCEQYKSAVGSVPAEHYHAMAKSKVAWHQEAIELQGALHWVLNATGDEINEARAHAEKLLRHIVYSYEDGKLKTAFARLPEGHES